MRLEMALDILSEALKRFPMSTEASDDPLEIELSILLRAVEAVAVRNALEQVRSA
jgi:hypothetical protein